MTAAAAEPERFRALLIGVWEYGAESGFDGLLGPPNDLAGLREAFQDPPTGLFAVSALPNPSTGELRGRVQRFLRASADENLLVYYSGHADIGSTGNLCLTSREADREYLDSSGLGFNELYDWVRLSQARTVTVVLDCCKAGSGFTKGSEPDLAGFFDRTRSAGDGLGKTIRIVSAVPDYTNAPDAAAGTEMSPFTADLYAALTGAAQADENGLVALSAVVAHLRAAAEERRTAPARVWGGDAGRDPYLAMRPDHLAIRLRASGLCEGTLVRRGAAVAAGREIRLEAPQVGRLASHFEERHPAVATVGGGVGSGKTWILCDVQDRLRAAGWHVVFLEPSADPVDSDRLRLDLRTYALGLRGRTERCLIVIDGIEWSETWSEFVAALDELTGLDGRDDAAGFGVSVLVALEGAQYEIQRSWQLPLGLNLPSVAQSGVAAFIARVMSPEFVPELAGWDGARLRAARTGLQKSVGTDLWAAVQLAVRWHERDADRVVIRELWRERIGDVSLDQIVAIQRLASLGRYNLWCPLRLAAPAGAPLLARLGVEYNRAHDAVRLNSGFLARAVLVRHVREGRAHFVFDRFAADRFARPLLEAHLGELLADVKRQDELATVIKRLRYHRFVFVPAVAALARPDADGLSRWEKWADNWTDPGPVNEVLNAVRTELPPQTALRLAERFFRYVSDHADEALSLWTLTASLETAYQLMQGRGSPSAQADEAVTRLVSLAEEKLRTGRWPSGVRRRLLRVLRRMGRLDQAAAEELGPVLLQPASPPTVADTLLVLDFARTVWRGPDEDEARAGLASWDSVGEDLVRRPEEAGVRMGLSHLAAQTFLARFIGDEATAERLVRRLTYRMRSARVGELGRALALCRRHDRSLAGLLAAQLDVDTWSAGLYRAGTSQEVASTLSTLGGIRPDLAVRTLRPAGGCVEEGLVAALAHQLVAGQDAVGASLLLRGAARIEEQAGLLEEGFAQALAARLGRTFLVDSLRTDSRISVLRYLIEGYAAARSPVLATVTDDALEIVENDIHNSATERGPRLALLLGDDTILGEPFLDELRARRVLLAPFMLDRMTDTQDAGALAAYHELGVALYPSLAQRFADRLEESGTEFSEHRLFRQLAAYGSVVHALRAATAVTTTLVLTGEPDPGPRVLAAFDRADKTGHAKANWAGRVVDSTTSEGLAEALNLLRGIDPDRAGVLLDIRSRKLERITGHAHADTLGSLLASVASISADAADRLVATDSVESAITRALTYLIDEADAFEQVEFLRSLGRVEDRVHRRLVPPQAAEALYGQWAVSGSAITNPRLLTGFVEAGGQQGAPQARRMAALVSASRVGDRVRRRNALDAEGAVGLVGVLGQLSADSVRGLLHADEARWLLLRAPLERTAALVETLLAAGVVAPGDAASVLAARFRLATGRLRLRDQHTSWISVGWIAWTLERYGVTLALEEPANAKALRGLHPHTALWATAWLAPLPWTAAALDDAAARVRAAGPPPRAWAASAVLTAEAALGRELAPDHAAWAHALDARPEWARALLQAAAPGTRLRASLTGLWPPLRLAKLRSGLHWSSRGWRRTPLEAARDLEGLAPR